jgi:hypothetical protein
MPKSRKPSITIRAGASGYTVATADGGVADLRNADMHNMTRRFIRRGVEIQHAARKAR